MVDAFGSYKNRFDLIRFQWRFQLGNIVDYFIPELVNYMKQEYGPVLPVTFSPARLQCPASGHWNYQDETEWSEHFPHCGGPAQSPINIQTDTTTFDSSLKPIRLSGYNVAPEKNLTLKNNGHTVVLDLPDNLLLVGGLAETYRAAQLHFHWGSESHPGSEHTVNGHRFPGEIHVVHYATEYDSIKDAASHPGGLAVLSAFIQKVQIRTPLMWHLLSYLERVSEEGQSTTIPGFDIRGLLPQQLGKYYRYNGSPDHPSRVVQTVNWTMFNQTVNLSREQMSILEDTIHSDHDHILQMNFRVPQSLNGRLVLRSFQQSLGVDGDFQGQQTDSDISVPGAAQDGVHALTTGDVLAIIFGVLFAVTAVAFIVYLRGNRSRNHRLESENKSNVIYKAATTEENMA
ncbi:LOW QUALITY PROTEIN: carbonic anhydrase 9-like [Rhinophrynus dorsalis]